MRGRTALLVGVVAAALVTLVAAPAASPAGSGDVRVPFSDILSNTCTSEAVLVTGVMHVSETATDNHDYLQVNWQDTRGVALVTGTQYQANDSSHLVSRDTSSGSTTYFQDEFELVSLAATPNLLAHVRVGFSIDRNGNPQVIMQGEAGCSSS